ncbi:hypothetical protein [Burkholderia guangdongensis]|uniref:hypothetical protein n=1 Tax=Burkholderia guangdongensis TaxID=1792500 RepID=UPI0015CCFAD6|nr:hypothetical protein [Burkholderia guangdongensis]
MNDWRTVLFDVEDALLFALGCIRERNGDPLPRVATCACRDTPRDFGRFSPHVRHPSRRARCAPRRTHTGRALGAPARRLAGCLPYPGASPIDLRIDLSIDPPAAPSRPCADGPPAARPPAVRRRRARARRLHGGRFSRAGSPARTACFLRR